MSLIRTKLKKTLNKFHVFISESINYFKFLKNDLRLCSNEYEEQIIANNSNLQNNNTNCDNVNANINSNINSNLNSNPNSNINNIARMC